MCSNLLSSWHKKTQVLPICSLLQPRINKRHETTWWSLLMQKQEGGGVRCLFWRPVSEAVLGTCCAPPLKDLQKLLSWCLVSQPGSFSICETAFAYQVLKIRCFCECLCWVAKSRQHIPAVLSCCAVCTTVITRPAPPLAPHIVSGREGDRNACDRAQPDVFIVRVSVWLSYLSLIF